MKTLRTLALALALIPVSLGAQSLIYSETFDEDLNDWAAFSVVGDTQTWFWDNFNGGQSGSGGQASMRGDNEEDDENNLLPSDDWLVSPAINLNQSDDEVLTFFSRWFQPDDTVPTDGELTLHYSTDWDGASSPETFTWTAIPFTSAGDQFRTWVPTGDIDVSGISGDAVYFAFRYQSNTDGTGSRAWTIDSFAIEGESFLPSLQVSTSTVTVFENGVGGLETISVDLSLPSPATEGIEFEVTAAEPTARDFIDTPSTIEFQASGQSSSIFFTAVDDTVVTGNQTFNFTLTAEGFAPVTIEVTFTDTDVPGTAPGLLFTQYYEGASSDKWIEITNPTDAEVSLNGWQLARYGNSAAEAWKSDDLASGSFGSLDGLSIAANSTITYANGSAALPFNANDADIVDTQSITFFNGNDTVALYAGTELIDVISFTNAGNEGSNTAFVRLTSDPGFDTVTGSSILDFPSVWQQVDTADVDSAVPQTDNFLGFSSLSGAGLMPTIAVGFDVDPVQENAGTGAVTVTVTLSDAVSAAVEFDIELSSTDLVTAPSSVTIDSGTVGTFTLDVGTDGVFSSDILVDLTISADGYVDGVGTLTVQNTDGQGVATVIISQYYEGASFNKWIELTNTTDVEVDLTGWSLAIYSANSSGAGISQNYKTGGPSSNSLALDGITVPGNGSVVFSHGSAAFPEHAAAVLTSNTVINFNGNDSVALFNDTVLVDVIGFTAEGNEGANVSIVRTSAQAGFDFTPGSTFLDFPSVWAAGDGTAQADDANPTDDHYLGFSLISGGAAPQIITLELDNSDVGELDGTVGLTVTLSAGETFPVVVALNSSDETEATVPDTVTFNDLNPQTVTVAVFDDGELDGDVSVDITASADGYTGATATLLVRDDSTPDPVDLPLTEDFETDGLNVRYALELDNEEDGGTDGADFFDRVASTTFVGLGERFGDFVLAGQDIEGFADGDAVSGIAYFLPINSTGQRLTVAFDVAASDQPVYDFGDILGPSTGNGDMLLVLAEVDGTLVYLQGFFAAEGENSLLYMDTDGNFRGDPATETAVTPEGMSVSLEVPQRGDVTGLVVEIYSTDNEEWIAFDNLSVTGVADTSPFIRLSTDDMDLDEGDDFPAGTMLVEVVNGSYPVTVNLSSSDDNELEVPTSVTVTDANGATVLLSTPVDEVVDGEKAVFVEATATGLDPAQIIFNVEDTTPVPALVLNELLYDPAENASGDANGDGEGNTSSDEFVEIVNASGGSVDMSGWELFDRVGLRHVFPEGTVIEDQAAVVVFGGGTPVGDFGFATVQTASIGFLGLNNSGDSVTLFAFGREVLSASFGDITDDQSLTLDPDLTGAGGLVPHSTATGANGALFSPGTLIDGTPFPGAATDLPEIMLEVSKDIVAETDPNPASVGTITVSPAPESYPLEITLESNDDDELSVPSGVQLTSGTQVSFDITVNDDGEIDEDETVIITASAAGYRSDSVSIQVLNTDELGEADVIISQIYETGTHKWIELANLDDDEADLSGWSIYTYNNSNSWEAWKDDSGGTPTSSTRVALDGVVISANGTFLIGAVGDPPVPAYATPDLDLGSLGFNGNDSIVLARGDTSVASIVDAVAIGGEDFSEDESLVRISTSQGYDLIAGSSFLDFPSVWQVVDLDTVNNALPGENARLGVFTEGAPLDFVSFTDWNERYPALGVASSEGDFDNDGLINQIEFVFDLDPTDATDRDNLPVITDTSGTTLTLVYTRMRAENTSWVYELTDDLRSDFFEALPQDFTETSIIQNGDGTETVTVEIDTTDVVNGFVRVKAEPTGIGFD